MKRITKQDEQAMTQKRKGILRLETAYASTFPDMDRDTSFLVK
jgi:hypothetical protein